MAAVPRNYACMAAVPPTLSDCWLAAMPHKRGSAAVMEIAAMPHKRGSAAVMERNANNL